MLYDDINDAYLQKQQEEEKARQLMKKTNTYNPQYDKDNLSNITLSQYGKKQ